MRRLARTRSCETLATIRPCWTATFRSSTEFPCGEIHGKLPPGRGIGGGENNALVERLDVEFRSEGVTCRAWLYRADGAGLGPTVVLAGCCCYVREVVMPT